MTRQEQFEYIINHWYLKDGVIYSHYTQKPVSFSHVNNGHHYKNIRIKGEETTIYVHQAAYMLHHSKPIGEDTHIHHIDGNPLNNYPTNLIELTPLQHRRLHTYQSNDPMRGIRLRRGRTLWEFRWHDDNGRQCSKYFHGINEAMKFRAEIEESYREELRALGLDC